MSDLNRMDGTTTNRVVLKYKGNGFVKKKGLTTIIFFMSLVLILTSDIYLYVKYSKVTFLSTEIITLEEKTPVTIYPEIVKP